MKTEALRALGPALWCLDHAQTLYGARIGARMTLIRLKDGGLMLISPVPVDDASKAEIDALGPVRHLVAPSLSHHDHLAAAAARWPEARRYGAPGLTHRRPDLGLDEELAARAPEGWLRQVDQIPILGIPAYNEVVFFHRASKTLILTLLIADLAKAEGTWTRLLLRLDGSLGAFAIPGFLRRAVVDGAAARASADGLLMWDFDRVILTHGPILATGGREAVARALAPLGPPA